MDVRGLLWVCAGADRNLLREDRSIGDRPKFSATGAAVLLTAGWAVISCAFALDTVFHTWVAWLFAPYWGVLIFNLDRYFVSTLRKRPNTSAWRLVGIASIRLLLAAGISVVIATPLVLKVFEPDLTRELAEENANRAIVHRAEVEAQYPAAQFLAEKSRIERSLTALDQAADRAAQQADSEGHGRFGRYGAGPFYRQDTLIRNAKIREANLAHSAAALRVRQLDAQIDSVRQVQEGQLQRLLAADANTGLLAQLHVLESLSQKDPIVKVADYVITFVLMMVETSPVLIKIMSGRGPYESRLDTIEEIAYLEDKDESERHSAAVENRVHRRMVGSSTIQAIREADANERRRFAEVKRATASRRMEEQLTQMDAALLEQFGRILSGAISHDRMKQSEEDLVSRLADQMIREVKLEYDELLRTMDSQVDDLLSQLRKDARRWRTQDDETGTSSPSDSEA